ncbi:hypothetical protein B7P43_G03475 [Cryptotermes secundus]|uniref:Ig-like domain-containing protein n=1 Tax=Cryptotermes secundus TaxID=105785 RepID=A0A2J7QZM8_9NEOP|nr:hypothetical protein B7P43_G03475 [Cryptotermes secundus]
MEKIVLKPILKAEMAEEKEEVVELKHDLEEQPVPLQETDEPRTEDGKSPEKTDLPWRRKKPKKPQQKPANDVGRPEEVLQTVQVTCESKDVEVPEEKKVAPWRRRKITKPQETIPVPVSEESKPEETEEPWGKERLQLPELKPVQVEDKGEEFTEEKKSETRVTLSTIQKQVAVRPKPEFPSEEIKESEEVHQIWQKEIKVDTVSKKKVIQHGRVSVPEDDRPLRELEIVTAKRVMEGVICLPEEPVVEDVEVLEDQRTVRHSLVQETAAEITTMSSKTVAPYFIQRLQPVTAKPNKTALFTCKVHGYPFPELTWYHNGVEIQPTSSTVFKVVESTATLEISNVTPDDVGNYTCQASNPAGVATSTANLVVIEKEESGTAPYFIQPLKPQVVQPKEVATLQCIVVGTPTPTVKWYCSNKELKPGRSREINYNSETGIATLKLLEPTEQDQTIYTVRAANAHGRAECRANLIVGEALTVHKPEVLHAPKITQPVQAKMVPAGDAVTLEAKFEGIPKPEVRWYRNGKELIPSEKVHIIIEEHRTTLHIPQVFRPDGGKYEVRAVNPAGEARSSGTVSITSGSEPEMAEVVPPRFIEPLKPQTVAEGEVVIMETRVESHPTCSFQWFHHSVPIKSSPELRVVTTDNHSVLITREALSEHAGIYTCRAENVVGSVTCTATLNVMPDTEWEDVTELASPTFVQKLANVRVMDGEEVHFTCQVTGKPVPKITWYHKNAPIKEAKDVTVYQDSEGVCKLAISEVFPEDAGEYTCHASNKVGEAVCAASLIVEAYEYVPDAEIASVTIGTSLAMGQSGSEEDLLTEKETVSEVVEEKLDTEAPQREEGKSPKFTTPLQKVYSSRDGELIRMEVKLDGKPKPKVGWYKQGTQIVSSKDFQIEEYEDGISVLTIPEVFPDDTGEITCVAENEFGVASTSTELVVEGIMGTKEYRKPEWVTQMEELKEQLQATQCVPTFVQEIVDVRAVELETVKFECQFSGTPKPDIVWYRNDKAIRNTKNVQIRIKDNKTSCTILKVTTEDKGTYVCKANSEIGTAVTKAKLEVKELPEEQKREHEIQQAREEKEKIKLEKAMIEKKREERRKKKGVYSYESGRETADVQEVQVLESTTQIAETTEKVQAERVLSVQESVSVSAIASCKKIDDETTENLEKPQEKAKQIMPVQEPLTVSETKPEDVLEDFRSEISKPQEVATRTVPVQQPVTVSEVHDAVQARELVRKKVEEKAMKETVSVQESVIVSQVTSESTIEELKEKQTEEKAIRKIPRQKSVTVSEVQSESTVEELKQDKPIEKAQRVIPVQESVIVSDIQSEATVKELQEKKPKTRHAKPEKKPAVKETAVVTEVKSLTAEEILEVEETKMATEVEELLKFVRAKEFGPGESPLRELAQIGFLVRQGVSVNEITTLYEADRFPALRTPEAQSAMVQVVEREGQGALISQVLTEESTADEDLVASTVGFRAFMRMVEMRHAAVEEVITHFAPEDFRPDAWETSEATQVVTKDSTAERVEFTEQREVHFQERKKVTKKTRTTQEAETEVSFSNSVI